MLRADIEMYKKCPMATLCNDQDIEQLGLTIKYCHIGDWFKALICGTG